MMSPLQKNKNRRLLFLFSYDDIYATLSELRSSGSSWMIVE